MGRRVSFDVWTWWYFEVYWLRAGTTDPGRDDDGRSPTDWSTVQSAWDRIRKDFSSVAFHVSKGVTKYDWLGLRSSGRDNSNRLVVLTRRLAGSKRSPCAPLWTCGMVCRRAAARWTTTYDSWQLMRLPWIWCGCQSQGCTAHAQPRHIAPGTLCYLISDWNPLRYQFPYIMFWLNVILLWLCSGLITYIFWLLQISVSLYYVLISSVFLFLYYVNLNLNLNSAFLGNARQQRREKREKKIHSGK